MAGLPEVCNHVGAILYKCMQQALRQNNSEASCTSMPCQWLLARKNILPDELRHIIFSVPLLDRCKSSIPQPKRSRTSAKSSLKLQLIEPSEADKEEFYKQLSTLKCKVSVLSVHHKFNKPYIPVSETRNIPAAVICYMTLVNKRQVIQRHVQN